MHATLLYTQPRGFYSSETLKQICENIFERCDSSPTIENVATRYSLIIKTDWKFKISEIVLTTNTTGTSFIMAKPLFEGRERIFKDDKPKISRASQTLQVYNAKQLAEMLQRNGFSVVGKFGIDGSKFVESKTERILMIAKRHK